MQRKEILPVVGSGRGAVSGPANGKLVDGFLCDFKLGKWDRNIG